MNKIYLTLILLCIHVFYSSAQEVRITGGEPINIKEAPWQVLLEINGSYGCGGCIVGDRWILTAKHCTKDNPTINVIYGVTSKYEVTPSKKISVKRIINHPSADISLLELNENIPINDNNLKISIPNYRVPVNTKAFVSGWGWLEPEGYYSSIDLQGVYVHIISNSDASRMLGSSVNDNEIATSGIGGIRQGACHGDSGGPLVAYINGIPQLIGVVSWGKAKCIGDNTNSPSVYVNTSSFYNWIYAHLPKYPGFEIVQTNIQTICDDYRTHFFKLSGIHSIPNFEVKWSHGYNNSAAPHPHIYENSPNTNECELVNVYNYNKDINLTAKLSLANGEVFSVTKKIGVFSNINYNTKGTITYASGETKPLTDVTLIPVFEDVIIRFTSSDIHEGIPLKHILENVPQTWSYNDNTKELKLKVNSSLTGIDIILAFDHPCLIDKHIKFKTIASSKSNKSNTMEIFDLISGEKVYQNNNELNFSIEDTSLKSGMYIIRQIDNDNNVTTNKVLKK